MDEEQQQLIEEINALGSLKSTYTYLIELGKAHQVQVEVLHQDQFKIPGCLSDAWLKVTSEGDRLHFELDHESTIMRGILVLILRVYNDKPAAYIARTQPVFLEDTGLLKQFAQSKANGLTRVIEHIRKTAKHHLNA